MSEHREHAPMEWRTSREPGWYRDIGYALQDVLRAHRYDLSAKGIKPDDPGWHACTCGWEGYWPSFHPHVADHLRVLATHPHAEAATTTTEGNERHG